MSERKHAPTTLAVDEILVGKRQRRDLGDITTFADDIANNLGPAGWSAMVAGDRCASAGSCKVTRLENGTCHSALRHGRRRSLAGRICREHSPQRLHAVGSCRHQARAGTD